MHSTYAGAPDNSVTIQRPLRSTLKLPTERYGTFCAFSASCCPRRADRTIDIGTCFVTRPVSFLSIIPLPQAEIRQPSAKGAVIFDASGLLLSLI